MRGDGFAEPTVLHVLEAVGGGTAKHLVDVVTHVEGVRHLVAVPTRRLSGLSDDAIADRLRDAGAQVHVTPMRRQPASRDNALAVLRLRRILQRERPDVIHGHASIGGALARAAVAATLTPFVWTPHAMLTGRGLVAAQRVLFRRADNVIALSGSERELIVRERVASPDDVVVIPNGVEPHPGPSPLDLRRDLGLPSTATIVGTIARLVPQKAPVDFVRTAAAVAARRPDVHFVLIGNGPLADDVDAEIVRLQLEGRFHRLVLPQGAGQLMDQFDVFVSTSAFEGGPYTPLEAMAAGVVAVVTDCIGNRDAVAHGRTGLTAPVGDAAKLADAVCLVLADVALRERLRHAAWDAVATTFDVRRMAERMKALYATVAGRTPVPTARRAFPVVLEGLHAMSTAERTYAPAHAAPVLTASAELAPEG